MIHNQYTGIETTNKSFGLSAFSELLRQADESLLRDKMGRWGLTGQQLSMKVGSMEVDEVKGAKAPYRPETASPKRRRQRKSLKLGKLLQPRMERNFSDSEINWGLIKSTFREKILLRLKGSYSG
jgi:hypothetical protein